MKSSLIRKILACSLGLPAVVSGCDVHDEGQVEAPEVEQVEHALVGTDVAGSYVPQQGEVVFCTGENFAGRCRKVSGPGPTPGTTGFTTIDNIGLPANDISSVKTGCGVYPVLCDLPTYAGDCEHRIAGTLPRDIPNLGNHNFNNRTESLKLVNPAVDCRKGASALRPGYVFLYRLPNFQGDCVAKYAGNFASSISMQLGDGLASSIIVGPAADGGALNVELYDGANFVTRMITVGANTSIADFRNTFAGNVDDRASSMKIIGASPLIIRPLTCASPQP